MGWALREMTANLLRVVRGAGKPYEIGRQAQALVDEFGKYYAVAGRFPPSEELSRFLDVSRDEEILAQCSEESRERAYAEERIFRGVLQVVASRLVDQRTQESAGRDEMSQGIRDLKEARERLRRAYESMLPVAPAPPRSQPPRPRRPKV